MVENNNNLENIVNGNGEIEKNYFIGVCIDLRDYKWLTNSLTNGEINNFIYDSYIPTLSDYFKKKGMEAEFVDGRNDRYDIYFNKKDINSPNEFIKNILGIENYLQENERLKKFSEIIKKRKGVDYAPELRIVISIGDGEIIKGNFTAAKLSSVAQMVGDCNKNLSNNHDLIKKYEKKNKNKIKLSIDNISLKRLFEEENVEKIKEILKQEELISEDIYSGKVMQNIRKKTEEEIRKEEFDEMINFDYEVHKIKKDVENLKTPIVYKTKFWDKELKEDNMENILNKYKTHIDEVCEYVKGLKEECRVRIPKKMFDKLLIRMDTLRLEKIISQETIKKFKEDYDENNELLKIEIPADFKIGIELLQIMPDILKLTVKYATENYKPSDLQHLTDHASLYLIKKYPKLKDTEKGKKLIEIMGDINEKAESSTFYKLAVSDMVEYLFRLSFAETLGEELSRSLLEQYAIPYAFCSQIGVKSNKY